METCPACGGVKAPPGTPYIGTSIVCICEPRMLGGTMSISFSYKPQVTQLDRIENKLDELLRIIKEK